MFTLNNLPNHKTTMDILVNPDYCKASFCDGTPPAGLLFFSKIFRFQKVIEKPVDIHDQNVYGNTLH